MTLDSELQGIVRENDADLLSFARKIYEHGFRQGLASRPEWPGQAASSAPALVEPSPIPQKPAPLFPSRATAAAIPVEEEEAAVEDDDAEAEPEAQICDHRVRGSITVAGLQRKIERLFDLSRFDIDIVICKRNDSERRRLKGTVHLKNYLLESE
jgi:hypothetical protein